MKENRILIICMILGLLLNSVSATLYEGRSNNPICSSGSQSLTASTLVDGQTTPEFDYSSSYFNTTNGDSNPLFVKKGSPDGSGTPFSFIFFNSELVGSSRNQVTFGAQTKDYTYVKLVNQFLFLKDSSKLYMYMYQTGSTTSTKQTLDIPTGFDVDSNIMPYYSSAVGSTFIVTVGFSKGTSTKIYKWTVDSAGTVSSSAGTQVGGDLGYLITKIAGTDKFIFDSVSKIFKLDNGITWTRPTNSTDGSVYDFTYPTVAQMYPFSSSKGILGVITDNGAYHRAILFSIDGTSMTEQINRRVDGYTFYSDGVSNVIFYNQESGQTYYNLDWANQRNNAGKTIIVKSISNTELNGVSGFTDIALNGNKAAFLLTSSNKIAYFRQLSIGIQHLFDVSYTPADMTLSGDAYQYKIVLGCACENLSRFTCFSSTLNCIIVKKAAGVCKGMDNISSGSY